MAILASFSGNLSFGKSYTLNLNHAQKVLQDLIERITTKLELMNVAKKLEQAKEKGEFVITS